MKLYYKTKFLMLIFIIILFSYFIGAGDIIFKEGKLILDNDLSVNISKLFVNASSGQVGINTLDFENPYGIGDLNINGTVVISKNVFNDSYITLIPSLLAVSGGLVSDVKIYNSTTMEPYSYIMGSVSIAEMKENLGIFDEIGIFGSNSIAKVSQNTSIAGMRGMSASLNIDGNVTNAFSIYAGRDVFGNVNGQIMGLYIEDMSTDTLLDEGALYVEKSYSIYSAGGDNYFKGNITSDALSGTGAAYACIDSDGKFYRSATACT